MSMSNTGVLPGNRVTENSRRVQLDAVALAEAHAKARVPAPAPALALALAHDARVFANSSLFMRGQNKTLLPNWEKRISNTDIPLVILGDPAYPLLDWLMKAFPDNGHLTQQQRKFNYRLSKARVVVEHAYGRLKGRWRCLLKRLDVNVHMFLSW